MALDAPATDIDSTDSVDIATADAERRRQAAQQAALDKQQQLAELEAAKQQKINDQLTQQETQQTVAGDAAIQAQVPEYQKPWAELSKSSPEVARHFFDAYGNGAAASVPKIWNNAVSEQTGVETGQLIAPLTPAMKMQAAKAGYVPQPGESADDLMTRMATTQPGNVGGMTQEQFQDLVDKTANYEIPPPWQRGGYNQAVKTAIQSAVAQQHPEYDAKEYVSRQAALTGFKSGAEARNITSANTVVGHLDTLAKAAADLQNRSLPAWNAVANTFESGTGDPRVVRFEAAQNAVATELAKLFKGGNAAPTSQEINDFKKVISPNMSPDQINGAIAQYTDLMGSRLQALQDQWDKGVKGPRTLPFLTPKSREILARIGTDPDTLDPVQKPTTQQGAQQRQAARAGIQPPVAPPSQAQNDMVPMTSKDGRAVMVPVQNVEAAKARGYK